MRIALQKRNGLIVSLFTLVAAFLLPVSGSLAGSNEVNFSITDNPGRWFDTGVNRRQSFSRNRYARSKSKFFR
jgi:hypothetical protein